MSAGKGYPSQGFDKDLIASIQFVLCRLLWTQGLIATTECSRCDMICSGSLNVLKLQYGGWATLVLQCDEN